MFEKVGHTKKVTSHEREKSLVRILVHVFVVKVYKKCGVAHTNYISIKRLDVYSNLEKSCNQKKAYF